jgi:adenylylsulfate kinase
MNIHSEEASTIWITGITASGKTTLGRKLFEQLIEKGVQPLEFLDGEEYRKRLDKTYGHSIEDRMLLSKKWVEIVHEKNRLGINVIISTVSHKKVMREYARSKIPRFMEIFLNCSSEVCANRDHKGHFKLAQKGEYELFPGVTEAYEPSDAPELMLKTDEKPLKECINILYREVSFFLGLDS